MELEKCNKIGHKTRDIALCSMKYANKNYTKSKNKHKTIKRVYKCDYCNLWHLTSKK